MRGGHSKILTSQKLSNPLSLFGLKKGFPGFVFLGCSIGTITCLVFYLVINMRKIFTKIVSNMVHSSKNIKKTSKCSNRTRKTRQILFHNFLDEHTLILTPSFWKGGMKIPKTVGRRNNFLKNYPGKNGGQRWSSKLEGINGFFHFSFLIITDQPQNLQIQDQNHNVA